MHFHENAKTVCSGPAVAASISPLIGFIALMITHHVSRLTPALDRLVHSWGYWMPGALGQGPDGSIGSYSGKETLALMAWAASWALFHFSWKNVDFCINRWIPLYTGFLFLIVLCFLHPVIDPVVLILADLTGLR